MSTVVARRPRLRVRAEPAVAMPPPPDDEVGEDDVREISEQVEAAAAEEEAHDTPEPEPATKRGRSAARRVTTSSRRRTPKSPARRSAVKPALKDPEPIADEVVSAKADRRAKRVDAEDEVEDIYATDRTPQPPGLTGEQIVLIMAALFVLGALFLWGTGLDKVISDALCCPNEVVAYYDATIESNLEAVPRGDPYAK